MNGWVHQRRAGSYSARRDQPVTLAEQFAMANWLRSGETVSDMAYRLRRPIPQVRTLLFGER